MINVVKTPYTGVPTLDFGSKTNQTSIVTVIKSGGALYDLIIPIGINAQYNSPLNEINVLYNGANNTLSILTTDCLFMQVTDYNSDTFEREVKNFTSGSFTIPFGNLNNQSIVNAYYSTSNDFTLSQISLVPGVESEVFGTVKAIADVSKKEVRISSSDGSGFFLACVECLS